MFLIFSGPAKLSKLLNNIRTIASKVLFLRRYFSIFLAFFTENTFLSLANPSVFVDKCNIHLQNVKLMPSKYTSSLDNFCVIKSKSLIDGWKLAFLHFLLLHDKSRFFYSIRLTWLECRLPCHQFFFLWLRIN